MDGNVILRAPFFDGKTAGLLLLKDGRSFGQSGLTKCLVCVH